ncbi:MAG: low temperature requirement protein A [Thermomicrobiales bacterium]|nr:low temperature requirement protein A [Thermomicrobiales bacterium]
MTVSSPHAPEQSDAATPLELFFDLVFVFAVSQLSDHLLADLSWHGIAETLVLLRAVYGVWYATSWVATMVPADEPPTRRMLLTVMPLGLFMNAALTGAFTASAWAFVAPYLLIQLGRTVWTVVYAPNALFRAHFFRALLWFVAISPFWIMGAVADPDTRLLWWALAAGIDQVGAWLAHPMPGRWLHSEHVPFASGHMLERCRLFLLIALGETVLTTGVAIAAVPLTPMIVVTGTVALVGAVALWNLGFGRTGRLTLRYVETTSDPVRASRYAVGVLMVMVAGLIAVAVANEEAIGRPLESGSVILNALMYGGPLLYVLAQAWYFRVMLQTHPRLRVIGAAVLIVLGISTVAAPRAVALAVATATLATMAVLDQE